MFEGTSETFGAQVRELNVRTAADERLAKVAVYSRATHVVDPMTEIRYVTIITPDDITSERACELAIRAVS